MKVEGIVMDMKQIVRNQSLYLTKEQYDNILELIGLDVYYLTMCKSHVHVTMITNELRIIMENWDTVIVERVETVLNKVIEVYGINRMLKRSVSEYGYSQTVINHFKLTCVAEERRRVAEWDKYKEGKAHNSCQAPIKLPLKEMVREELLNVFKITLENETTMLTMSLELYNVLINVEPIFEYCKSDLIISYELDKVNEHILSTDTNTIGNIRTILESLLHRYGFITLYYKVVYHDSKEAAKELEDLFYKEEVKRKSKYNSTIGNYEDKDLPFKQLVERCIREKFIVIST